MPARLPPLNLALVYQFKSPKVASLLAVQRDGLLLRSDTFQFNERGFRGFQLLLCETWNVRERNELGLYHLTDPPNLARPLYNAVREDTTYAWISYIFGDDRLEAYLAAKIERKKPTSWITQLVKITVKIAEERAKKHRDATVDEVALIIANLRNEEIVRTVDLSILSHSPSQDDQWSISGRANEKNLHYGCHVRIHVEHERNPPPLVFWFSNHEIYELYPEKDPRLSNVPRALETQKGNLHELLIGAKPGIPIDTKAGVESCLAITADSKIDRNLLRKSIATFFRANPVSSFRWDQGPTKRYFNGKLPREVMESRLGNPSEGRDWTSDLLQEVIPEGSIAVLLTLPLGEQKS